MELRTVPSGVARTGSGPSVHPAPPPPPSLRGQLDAIHAACQELSAQHRLSVPPKMVQARMGSLARAAAEVFQERAIQICFLLDQYGTMRYNELRRAAEQPSTRTLAEKLAFLQDRGLVFRRFHDQMPPRVEYGLTPRGKRLTDLLFPALLLAADPTLGPQAGAAPSGTGGAGVVRA